MDLETQELYIEKYKIDSTGNSWLVNKMLETLLNTFIYKKIIEKLNIELLPPITEKLIEINSKLASSIEIKHGISILGKLKTLTVTHFEIKERDVWIIVNLNGWGIIEIEGLEI